MQRTYRLSILVPILLLLLFSGCVDTEEQAGVFRATYSWWVGVSAMAGGILLTIGGWFWKQDDFRGWIFFIFALVATVAFLPVGFVDHVTIDEERLTSQWGFLGLPNQT